jgi:catechol 2,3-dioxygenase-like lactoylglutathione lyase family enzyme
MPIGDETAQSHSERRRRPETLRLRAVMPILEVSDLERSVTWYRDILGFVVAEELREDGQLIAVQLKAGKVRFLLERETAPPAGGRGQGVHLYCATRQDVTRLAGLIQERGGVIEQAPDDSHGGRDFAILDPDGYRISIFRRPESQ